MVTQALPALPVLVIASIKPIPGFDGYAAADDGRIFTCVRGGRVMASWRELPAHSVRGGYRAVAIRGGDGRFKSVKVHRLVLFAFRGPPAPGLICCHSNGSPSDNSLSNLRWDTHKSNNNDTAIHGRQLDGSRAPAAVLDETKAAEIRAKYATGKFKLHELAAAYGVTKQCIGYLTIGSSWKNVGGQVRIGSNMPFVSQGSRRPLTGIGLRIRAARKRSGLTMKRLGGKCGVTEAAVWDWEMNRNHLPKHQVPLLCAALGITEEQLLAGD